MRWLSVLFVLLGMGGQLALTVLILVLGFGWWSAPLIGPLPWWINLTWLLLFALQHSAMARHDFKRRWTRLVPPYMERSIFVGLSGLVLIGLCATWQPVPGPPIWELPAWVGAIGLLGGAGAVLIGLPFGQAQFLGLWQGWHGRLPSTPEPLLILGPYRYVRHPLMTCMLVFLWGQPVMSLTLALLSGGLTMYILLAVRLEERELLCRYGDGYREYRRRVPALLPFCPPVAAATHPALEER